MIYACGLLWARDTGDDPGAGGGPSPGDFTRAHEDVLFKLRIDQERRLFRQREVMGWVTIVAVPVNAIVGIIDPFAGASVAPLTALAAWHWRAMLRRGAGIPVPMPKAGEGADEHPIQ
jgi:hypothetical protein